MTETAPEPTIDPDAEPQPIETPGVPSEPGPEQKGQVIGLTGKPVAMPTGLWLAAVDESGDLVKQDGHLVRVREQQSLG